MSIKIKEVSFIYESGRAKINGYISEGRAYLEWKPIYGYIGVEEYDKAPHKYSTSGIASNNHERDRKAYEEAESAALEFSGSNKSSIAMNVKNIVGKIEHTFTPEETQEKVEIEIPDVSKEELEGDSEIDEKPIVKRRTRKSRKED